MAISKKNRSDLKSYFVKNAIPTESQFSDLIDGMLNQDDDGIFKLPDDPLSIVATGGPDSQKKAIQLYETYAADATPAWVLSLSPRAKASDPATARPGFSISDNAGTSRLFIDKATGNVGIGTVAPAQTLHVNGGAKVRGFTDSLGVSVNDGSNTGVGRGLWLWKSSDSNHVIYSANPSGKSPANNVPPAGFFDKGHRMRFRTFKGNQGFLFENHAEEALVDIDSGDGRLWTKGAIYAGNSDIYFTNTEHKHSGIGNTEGHAAIENAKSHNALMILGRAGTSKGRAVKLWDYLEVNGDLSVTRNVDIDGAMRATGGVRIDGDLGAHVEADGSFYRYNGQVYITVDDHLYIRDKGGDIKFHFQTNSGVIVQENWQSPELLNGWVNYSNTYNLCQYFKDSMGIVHLKGLVKNGGGGTVIFNLPAGYRPLARQLHAVCTRLDTIGRCDVATDGNVICQSGNSGWFSLDGITFRAHR